MTPQEHLDTAERYLARAEPENLEPMMGFRYSMALIALTHAVMAIAIETGVPHSAGPVGGAASDQ